jgi:hypothetical protein
MAHFLSTLEAENAANGPGDHEFFVRANDGDRNPAGRRGNHVRIGRISLFFEFDSKESQPIANPGANSANLMLDEPPLMVRMHV